MSVCANIEGSERYFHHKNYIENARCFCSTIYSTTTQLLAKCYISCLARFIDISENEFKLTQSEVKILHELMSHAADDEEGECSAWPVYTLTTAHYLCCLLSLSSRLVLNEHNAELFAESVLVIGGRSLSIFDTLNLILTNHSSDHLILKNAHFYLEVMSNKFQGFKSKLLNFPDMIRAIKNVPSTSPMDVQKNAHFCLLSLGFDSTYDAGEIQYSYT